MKIFALHDGCIMLVCLEWLPHASFWCGINRMLLSGQLYYYAVCHLKSFAQGFRTVCVGKIFILQPQPYISFFFFSFCLGSCFLGRQASYFRSFVITLTVCLSGCPVFWFSSSICMFFSWPRSFEWTQDEQIPHMRIQQMTVKSRIFTSQWGGEGGFAVLSMNDDIT